MLIDVTANMGVIEIGGKAAGEKRGYSKKYNSQTAGSHTLRKSRTKPGSIGSPEISSGWSRHSTGVFGR
jgi:hypothetical protein